SRNRLRAASPSMPGNRTSRMTASGLSFSARSRAASAEAATPTVWPWRSNALRRAQEMASSSSTIRSLAGMVSGYPLQAVPEMPPQGPGGRGGDVKRLDPEPADVAKDGRVDHHPRHGEV